MDHGFFRSDARAPTRTHGKEAVIREVVDAGLCHACGACQTVCPVGAISFRESVGGYLYPVIDDARCSECGLCLRVCAGIAVAPSFADALPDDPFTGRCLHSWVGKSQDATVYREAQSGGVVTQLLLDLLESGEVDACAVVGPICGTPPRSTAFLATDRQGILRAQKSKYCPVPVVQVLAEARRENWRVAMVGLACHFHGLSLIDSAGFDIETTVRLKIGLICDRTLALAAVDYLVKQALGSGSNARVVFRDKPRTGYPGDVTVQDRTGKLAVLPQSTRLRIKDLMTPARCRLCFDKMNVLADVTVGDPWGIDRGDRRIGESVVVVRTERGQRAVQRALQDRHLSLRPVTYESILRGQQIDAKRTDWRTYCEAWKQMGQPVPGYFSAVARHAPESQPPGTKEEYRRRLRWALTLNHKPSREVLLRSIHRKVRLAKVRDQVGRAVAFARHRLWQPLVERRKG